MLLCMFISQEHLRLLRNIHLVQQENWYNTAGLLVFSFPLRPLMSLLSDNDTMTCPVVSSSIHSASYYQNSIKFVELLFLSLSET